MRLIIYKAKKTNTTKLAGALPPQTINLTHKQNKIRKKKKKKNKKKFKKAII